ncbi:T9SS type A sorting domain-containing protein [Neolewinella aurantiaca]|uniref:T9SS type A sorting domain-containing protein n=1 Tax=Neolewinella aurantiaca TaxID=2602767 RepID=A0A5C7FLK7_9BACT|nr:T9SS type A sorting domain-containing protein [Neolewinella aurantiaca]TXF86266.1 T9SS type A sorting domain-containing protein [Neolewinella aurantiaca]
MKSCYTLLLLLLLSVTTTAQSTIFDFEGDVPTFNDFNGSVTTVVDNPDANEPNTSAKVAQNVIPPDFAFSGTNIPQTVDFANGKTFTMQVWSPATNVPVLLKLERSTNDFREVAATFTGAANSWQELTFDFSAEANQSFSSVTIFMNFNVVGGEEMTFYYDNLIQSGDGGGGNDNLGPTTAAPAPTAAAEDVISLFSDAYDDVTVTTFLTGWSLSGLIDTVIDGSAMKLYSDLNFAGIETTGGNALDISGMTHLHIDFWSANSTNFRVKLVDFGGDGFEGASADTEFEIATDVAQGQWISLDYPLVSFEGMNQTDINQFIIASTPAGMSDVYLDNIYFYSGVELGAQMDLPVTFDEEGVDYGLADFGGNASSIVADPEDATNTVAQSVKTAGAATWAGTTLSSTAGGPVGFASQIPFTADATTMSVRVWSPTAGTPVLLKVEKADDPNISVETLTNTTVAGAWDTLVFDFSMEAPGTAAINFAAVYDKASIFFNFGTEPAADATYYWDDIFFGGNTSGNGGGGDDEPMTAAPTPTHPAENVISMFSDAYTDVVVDTWRTDWSSGNLEDIMIEGNATKKYTNLDFVGIETIGANAIDLTTAGMTHLHLDYWTPNMDTFRIKLVDFGMDGFDGGTDTENEQIFMVGTGQWNSLDIPLEDFAGMNQTDINQFIISGLPVGAGTIYIDNVYYYKEIVDGTNDPITGLLEAFPNPIGEEFVIIAPERMESLVLFNTNGEKMGEWRPMTERFTLEASHLAPGFYVALVRTDRGLMTVKVVKE